MNSSFDGESITNYSFLTIDNYVDDAYSNIATKSSNAFNDSLLNETYALTNNKKYESYDIQLSNYITLNHHNYMKVKSNTHFDCGSKYYSNDKSTK